MTQDINLESAINAGAQLTIRDCYWEIGDANGVLASGQAGTMSRDTVQGIASASKWIYGAYVAQSMPISSFDAQYLNLTSGFIDSAPVTSTRLTVQQCAAASSVRANAEIGRFFYGGGHHQVHAAEYTGLRNMKPAALGVEVSKVLGVPVTYKQATLAAGAQISAGSYAALLQRILRQELAIYDHLGQHSVCTLPAACPTASSSPSPFDWRYSIGHWVETDGAFSSLGAFGFYPWIDKSRRFYGIVAPRQAVAATRPAQEFGQNLRAALFSVEESRKRPWWPFTWPFRSR